jgi:hypothetical protein
LRKKGSHLRMAKKGLFEDLKGVAIEGKAGVKRTSSYGDDLTGRQR